MFVPSDDCAVAVGGQVYHPHRGEWVEVRDGMSVADFRPVAALAAVETALAAARGEADEAEQVTEIEAAHHAALVELLGGWLVAWNWTDDRGEPLPPPRGSVLSRLRAEELVWLQRAVLGETPAQEKARLEALADHFLGYSTSADPDSVRTGPQPYEGVLSAICATFGCSVAQAEREPWPRVRQVIDQRNAENAIELFNSTRKDRFDVLNRSPELQRILLAMHRAQRGDAVGLEHITAAMQARGDEDDG